MKRFFTVFLVAVLSISFFSVLPVKADIWDSWSYYKVLTFDGGFEGLQVNFNVTYDYDMNADFSDLRFVDFVSGELLFAFNESQVNGEYCNVWLKLDGSLSVIMYYGNVGVSAYWDIDEVFIDVISGVVLALPMDEGSGSVVYDYSGNNLDGNINGAIFNSGIFSNGLFFDGNDYIEGSNNPILNFISTNFSLSFWYKPSSVSSPDGDMLYTRGKNNLDGIQFYTSGTALLFTTSQAGITQYSSTAGVLVNNSWCFLTITRFGSSVKIYVNGTDRTNVSGEHINPLTSSRTWKVGVYDNKVDVWLFGFMDNVIFFNNLLNSNEIDNMFSYFSDSSIIEGSVCCREWNGGVMPSVVFGVEVVSALVTLENNQDLLFAFGCIIIMISLSCFIVFYEKRKNK